MVKRVILSVSALLLFFFSDAQNGFERWDTLHVTGIATDMKNPWAGGLNAPQFSQIDLNGDGIKDLFAFDRSFNRVITFVNGGHADSVDYRYAPHYASAFPKMRDIALLADYNCDGKEDIFTYSTFGGLAVWRNDYTSTSGLVFTKVTQLLLSTYVGNNLANLYVSPGDLPAISDMDGDGDLDILTLAIGGSRIEYHKNHSQELFGSCDSLVYKQGSECWGNIFLNSATNSAQLNQACRIASPVIPSPEHGLHGGATFLSLDLDGDNDMECLVGDLGFPSSLMLINGGTQLIANITSQDFTFPSTFGSPANPVNLASMPAAFYLDVNNDGKKDLLFAPNAINVSENFTSVWYYKNTGTNANPLFQFVKNSFLQDEMIECGEGNNPAFIDVDGDSRKDLIIGNHGYYHSTGIFPSGLSLYKNTGTATNPAFQLVTRDYSGIQALGISNVYPTFGDMDHDGDPDMIVGDYNGNVHLFSNNPSGSNFVFTLSSANYFDIDVGSNAAPQIIDLDRDGLLDLVIGRRNGKVSYYRNIGSQTTPLFTSAPDNPLLGNIDVVDYNESITGYASPYIVDGPGGYKMFVGSERGYLYYYAQIDGNLNGNFALLDSVLLPPNMGGRLSISGGDINLDGRPDLVIGNYGGGCGIYRNDSFTGIHKSFSNAGLALTFIPNPTDESVLIETGLQSGESRMISLFSVTGARIVQKNTTQEKVVLNTKEISEGIYICQIICPNRVVTGKLVVKH